MVFRIIFFRVVIARHFHDIRTFLGIFPGHVIGTDRHRCHLPVIPLSDYCKEATTSESALAGIHKFTIVVRTGPERVDKLVRQIEKKIDVLKTFVYTSDEVVQQEIALYKVTRSRSVERLVRQHNVRILEIDDDYIVVEKTGHKAETKELFRLLQPYGVQQFVRSGIVAIIKSRRELLNEYLEELERSRRQTNSNHF